MHLVRNAQSTQTKSPAITSRGSLLIVWPPYAALFADSDSVSGTGPQMYAEKTGMGSVLSPREMMIPRGSVGMLSLRSFFMTLSLYEWLTDIAAALKAPDMPYRTSSGKPLSNNDLRSESPYKKVKSVAD